MPSGDWATAGASPPASVAMLERLAQRVPRMTGPRQTIVECVAPRVGTFTAQEIVEQLHERHPGIGRATVFRTLDLLAELGALHRIHNDDGYHLYAVCADEHHHHHLRCVACGMIQIIQAPGVETELQRVAAGFDFDVIDHVIELVGRCATCRAKVMP
jgi:Fur family ferric uptake transcriptional regulator